jgi:diguanylate cyclase (GGDEF)-like protein/PAS domain S-box-containing protein
VTDDVYREGFARLPVATMVVDASGRVVDANDALFGLAGRELTGREASELFAPGDREVALDGVGPSFTVERRIRVAGGRVVPVQIDGVVLPSGYVVAQLREVPERAHDPLTGLPERARFEELLGRHVAGIQRYGADGALVLVGLDGLLELDELDGDRALIAGARAIEKRLRTTDLATRVGDMFRVLLPRGSASEAMVVARDVRDVVAAATGLTCSLAVAPFEDPDDATDAGRRVRAALEEVRRAGGDGVAAALPRRLPAA